jgi:hypothetical protein
MESTSAVEDIAMVFLLLVVVLLLPYNFLRVLLVLFVQYCMVGMLFFSHNYKTKKSLVLDLIPFYVLGRIGCNWLRDGIDNIKKMWGNLT